MDQEYKIPPPPPSNFNYLAEAHRYTPLIWRAGYYKIALIPTVALNKYQHFFAIRFDHVSVPSRPLSPWSRGIRQSLKQQSSIIKSSISMYLTSGEVGDRAKKAVNLCTPLPQTRPSRHVGGTLLWRTLCVSPTTIASRAERTIRELVT